MFSKRDLTLFNSFIFSGLFSFIVIFVFSIISGAPAKDEVFIQSVNEWARPGYIATNDFRNYILGILLFSLSPYFFYSLLRRRAKLIRIFRTNRKLLILSSLILFLTTLIIATFLTQKYIIPRFDEINHILATKKRGQQLKQDIIYVPLTLLLFFTVYISFKYKLFDKLKRQLLFLTNITKKILNSVKAIKLTNLVDILVPILIFILIFNPKYKYSYQSLSQYGGEANYQFHHVISFIGPINDVLNGKSLMVDTNAQYGLLTTYIPAIIFSFIPLSFANFTLYNMILAVIYANLFYLFLRIITKNRLFAFLGTLAYIKIVFFKWFWPDEIFVYPSSTPLRYFWDILAIFAVYNLYRSFSLRKSLLAGIIISSSFFYNVEIGVPILVSFLATIVLGLVVHLLRKRIMNTSLNNFFALIVSFLTVGVGITLVTFFRSSSLPNWYSMLISPLFYAKGFFDAPAPVLGTYYIPLSIYLFTYYIIIYKFYVRNYQNIEILFFILLYGITSFVYFLGFSEPHHLFTVIHPALILVILFASWGIKNTGKFSSLTLFQKSTLVTFTIVIIIFIAWSPVKFIKDLRVRLDKRYSNVPEQYFYWSYPGTDIYLKDSDGKDFFVASEKIKKYSGENREALILSRYDTLLSVMSQKSSFLGYSYLEYAIVYKADLDKAILQIKEEKPEYVFVYSEKYNQMKSDILPKTWEGIKVDYSFVEQGGVIDVYRLIYRPHLTNLK